MDQVIELGFIPVIVHPRLVDGEIVVDPLECEAIADVVAQRLLTELANG